MFPVMPAALPLIEALIVLENVFVPAIISAPVRWTTAESTALAAPADARVLRPETRRVTCPSALAPLTGAALRAMSPLSLAPARLAIHGGSLSEPVVTT